MFYHYRPVCCGRVHSRQKCHYLLYSMKDFLLKYLRMKKYFLIMALVIGLTPAVTHAQYQFQLPTLDLNYYNQTKQITCDMVATIAYRDPTTNTLTVKIHYTTAGVIRDVGYSVYVTSGGSVIRGGEGKVDLEYEDAYAPLGPTNSINYFIDSNGSSDVTITGTLGGKTCVTTQLEKIPTENVQVPLGGADIFLINSNSLLQVNGIEAPNSQIQANVPALDQPEADGEEQAGAAAGAEQAQAQAQSACQVIAEGGQTSDTFTAVAAVVYEGFAPGETPFRVSGSANGREKVKKTGAVIIENEDVHYLLDQDGEGFVLSFARSQVAQTYSIDAKIGDTVCESETFVDLGAGQGENPAEAGGQSADIGGNNTQVAGEDEQVERVAAEQISEADEALIVSLGLGSQVESAARSAKVVSSIALKDIVLYSLLGVIAVALVTLAVKKRY